MTAENNVNDQVRQLDKEVHRLKRSLEREEKKLVYSETLLDQTQHLLNTRIAELENARAELGARTIELEKSEEQFRQLADATFEGIIIHTKERILYANRPAEEMHGYNPGKLIGRDPYSLTQRKYRDRSGENRIVDTGGHCEVINLKKDGSTFTVELRSKHIIYHGQAAQVMAVRDISERIALERELTRLARIDPLTSINNRRFFLELCEDEFSRARRYGRPLSVMMLDIDHFKRVNDTYGHAAGDATIQALVVECKVHLRKPDILGRLWGEEFAIAMPETEADECVAAAERIRERLEATSVPFEAHTIHLTVSIGTATLQPSEVSFLALLARADRALYRAKDGGRNLVVREEDPAA